MAQQIEIYMARIEIIKPPNKQGILILLDSETYKYNMENTWTLGQNFQIQIKPVYSKKNEYDDQVLFH